VGVQRKIAMDTNILIAIANFMEQPISKVKEYSKAKTGINIVGEPLEYYIKDLFCNTLAITDRNEKDRRYSDYFSYLGNQNNPPDFVIRNGDAVEVKKIESLSGDLELNSSYPRNKLNSDDPMISKGCRKCEEWSQKDLIYIIGTVNKGSLKSIWLVYGDCYAADRAIYRRIANTIRQGITEIQGVQFTETKELGRVNKVDPMGITYLRVRGMWGIAHPAKVFQYLCDDAKPELSLNAIMLKDKYLSFPQSDRARLESIEKEGYSIKDVEIKYPDNPAKWLEAKHISYKVK